MNTEIRYEVQVPSSEEYNRLRKDVGLMSAVGKEPFYHRFRFTSRPTESLGCGMTRFWEVEQDPPGFEQDGHTTVRSHR